ncbi:unnamed protein product [Rotaria sp. Silwood2]|nr:unnamed protein product [Rotaria sp. Silwood2]CAF3129339.1 unnamed protein product [Rotaria sp. Silwood2]
MAQSNENIPDFLTSMANISLAVMQHLRAYDWDVEAAAESYLYSFQRLRTQETPNCGRLNSNLDRSTSESLNEHNDHSPQPFASDDHQINNESQIDSPSSSSSQQLNHSLREPIGVDLSNQGSFIEHSNCFTSNTDGSFPLFPNIHEHYHGSTAAIHKTVDILQLRADNIRNQYVVFVSTSEHHSNILPWKETGVEFVQIPNNKQGLLDQNVLKTKLKYYREQIKKNIICTFSAASNVTGILADVDPISELVHEHEGLIFWDYAAAAPHVHINMNPSEKAAKDAVFISTHKFVGGPGAPGNSYKLFKKKDILTLLKLGLLIAKKKIFTNRVPSGPGGGTVNYVTRQAVEYTKDIETREEGGTPNILGSIRAGLVFILKHAIGHELIDDREKKLVDKFIQRFRDSETLLILGPLDIPRLAIFSFLIYVPSIGKYLHHNFVCSLLNDLFGIQVRSGCSCAGPYVLIDDEKADIYTRFITEDSSRKVDNHNLEIPQNSLMKPGFTRFNLSYFIDDEEVNYILDSIDFIAQNGWRFLPLYMYDSKTAIWHPRHLLRENHFIEVHQLETTTFQDGTIQETTSVPNSSQSFSRQLSLVSSSLSLTGGPLQQARVMCEKMPEHVYKHLNFLTDAPLAIPQNYKDLIWFIEPKEVVLELLIELGRKQQQAHTSPPFKPRYKTT